MSILLDALKKSESQRQLGTTPGIHTTIEPPTADGPSGSQWIPLSMLFLSVVVIACLVGSNTANHPGSRN